MKELLTCDDFVDYVVTKQTGNESWPGWMKKHFKIIENNLLDGEYGLVCFMLMVGKSAKRIAGVLTNKRLIIAQDKIVGNQLITISVNNINDIYIKNGLIDSTLIIDSFKETIMFTGLKKLVRNTNSELNNALNYIKNNLINDNYKSSKKSSKYDELKKLKELLDDDVISKEEFNKEKEKLLNS